MIDLENSDYITSFECIALTDEKIISLIIPITKVHIFYKLCLHNNLDNETLVGSTECNYPNNGTVLQSLEDFIKQT